MYVQALRLGNCDKTTLMILLGTPLAKSSGNSGVSPYQIMEDMLDALEQRIH